MAATPYTIEVPSSSIEFLEKKLAVSTFPDELSGAKWNYGTPLAEVKRLAAYWQHGFDWRKQEAAMNELPHFRTDIDVDGFASIDLHFVHQKSDNVAAIPLLFVHGCTYLYYIRRASCNLGVMHIRCRELTYS